MFSQLLRERILAPSSLIASPRRRAAPGRPATARGRGGIFRRPPAGSRSAPDRRRNRALRPTAAAPARRSGSPLPASSRTRPRSAASARAEHRRYPAPALVADLRLLDRQVGVEHRLQADLVDAGVEAVSYTHLRAHETGRNLVCRLLL